MKAKNFIFYCASAISVCTAFGNLQAQWQTSGSNIFNTNSGNVGIGTSNPFWPMHMHGNINGEVPFVIENTYGGNTRTYLSTAPGQSRILSTHDIFFWTHNGTWSEKFVIKNNGNVGIGTHNPLFPMHMHGNINGEVPFVIENTYGGNTRTYLSTAPGQSRILSTHDITFWTHNGTWSDKFIIKNNGNVGIGTTNPTSKLTVAGDISATQYTSDSDISAIGIVLSDDLIYEQKSLGHYSLGWYSDPWYLTGNSLWASGYGGMKFFTGGLLRLAIHIGGNVGIGTTNPTSKLTVAGDIRAREILVDANAGADFVFAPDYRLRPLNEVETFIKANRHLPDIASADSMVQNGVNMGEMQIKLLQKIEELTLYVIELEKKNEAQQKAYHLEIEALKNEIDKIKDDE